LLEPVRLVPPVSVGSRISVIVPTRDRPGALEECLDALSRQSCELEVVVVDDGVASREDVEGIVARYSFARLVRGRGAGPAAARNAGASAARGDFFCFTDDDCQPAREWAERLVAQLEQGADAVAGTTLSCGGALDTASEIAAHAPAVLPPPPGSDLAFAPSNNLACTRAVFESVPFDESFPLAAGEDREWCASLLAAGHTLRAEPTARIVHRQRLTFRSFVRQQARYGEGAFRFRRDSETPRTLEGIGFYVRLLRQGFAEGPLVGLLVGLAQAATATGFARGWRKTRGARGVVTTDLRARASREDGA
jgi:glycosyltransferase involved in cell wall biosynthesis